MERPTNELAKRHTRTETDGFCCCLSRELYCVGMREQRLLARLPCHSLDVKSRHSAWSPLLSPSASTVPLTTAAQSARSVQVAGGGWPSAPSTSYLTQRQQAAHHDSMACRHAPCCVGCKSVPHEDQTAHRLLCTGWRDGLLGSWALGAFRGWGPLSRATQLSKHRPRCPPRSIALGSV